MESPKTFIRSHAANILAVGGFVRCGEENFSRRRDSHNEFITFSTTKAAGEPAWGFGVSVEFPRLSWLCNRGSSKEMYPLGCHITLLHDPARFRVWTLTDEYGIDVSKDILQEQLTIYAEPFFRKYYSIQDVLDCVVCGPRMCPFAQSNASRLIVATSALVLTKGYDYALEHVKKAFLNVRYSKPESRLIEENILFIKTRPDIPTDNEIYLTREE